jgi:hypothetical protein
MEKRDPSKKQWGLKQNGKKRKRATISHIESFVYEGMVVNFTEVENPSVLHPQLQHFYNISSDGTNVWDDPSHNDWHG